MTTEQMQGTVVVTFTPDEAWTTHWELNEAFGECEPPWGEQGASVEDGTDLKAQTFFALEGALRAVRIGLRDAGIAFLGTKGQDGEASVAARNEASS